MSDKETHKSFESLLARYLSGELSTGEKSRFEEMLARDPRKKASLEEYMKVWDSAGSAADRKRYDLDAEWEMLRRKLPSFESAGKPATRSVLFYIYRVAAALAVGLIFAFSWIYATRMVGTKVVTASGEPVEVVLDDGSRVIINRNSRISYGKRMSTGERKVQLAGEAWFDVARDTSRPFVVDAGKALVEVLGTSFNVNAYRDSPVVEITVESGKVALAPKQDIREQIVLTAGNSGTYHKKSRQLELIPASDPNNMSWRTRELYFENTSLEEVVELINRVYNCELVILNRDLSGCPITVTFKNQSLDAILKVLEVTLDLEISQTDGQVILDGEGCDE